MTWQDLDKAFLTQTFNKCLATPENLARKASALRFKIGDAVECHTAGGVWSAGTVVAVLVRAERLPEGTVAPYQVQLEGGGGVLVPSDDSSVVRRPYEEEYEEYDDDDDEEEEEEEEEEEGGDSEQEDEGQQDLKRPRM
jgi:hypothetical protein